MSEVQRVKGRVAVLLRGPSGVGKTSVCNAFARRGVAVVEEQYQASVHPAMRRDSLSSKLAWCGDWFRRLFGVAERMSPLIVCDRSPLDAVVYATSGHLLIAPIEAALDEAASQFGITWVNVYLHAPLSTLAARVARRWENVDSRDSGGPEDLRRRETDDCEAARAFNAFETTVRPWADVVIETGDSRVEKVVLAILSVIEGATTRDTESGPS